MNVWSLFSGVGGLDLGIERSGGTVVLQCEVLPWRRELLAVRFPGVPCFTDVAALRVEPAPRAEGDGRVTVSDGTGRVHTVPVPDLVIGGFPCQDVSVAGQRRGLAGDRTGLFFDACRLVEAVRPRAVLLENVPGLLSSNGGRDFGVVLGTLADLGYGVAWRVLDSRFFGVPQRRRRVFICGVDAPGRAGADLAGEVLAVGSRCARHPATRDEEGTDDPAPSVAGTLSRRYGKGVNTTMDDGAVAVALTSGGHPNSNAPGRRKEDDFNVVAFNASGGGEKGIQERDDIANPVTGSNGDPGAVAYALRKDPGGVGQGHNTNYVAGTVRSHVRPASNASEEIVQEHIVRRLMPVECERLQGFPDGWTDLGDTPDTPRYSALGDAVTVTVSEWIGGRL